MSHAAELLERVRVSSGLTQEELARRAGTSRPTLSAYEHGRKSPTVATFARLLAQAGWDLAVEPHVSFTQQASSRGKPAWTPNRLPRLDVTHALATVELPLHLNWSAPGRIFDLRSTGRPGTAIRDRATGRNASRHPRLRRRCPAR
jgi:transcriptional regulator with XRE-family HTH domain